ncbi:hypothetical protein LZ30DRAFT_785891 [Colletotrichum cereale]|nr:hypothetical protein LZ30DRAFT_785891 [Colletotrichum cereale]
MVGQISYTTEQIIFVLEKILADKKRDIILYEYQKKFSKTLSVSQFRYIRNKYGHDPEFGEERSQRHPQPQLQHVAFPKSQSQPGAPEPSGTYWFDQYAPTAYQTPYGYQPVLHYNYRLLHPSTAQKRHLEEPDEVLPSSTARPTMPIGGFNGLSSLSAAVTEPLEEPKAKRMRLGLQNDGSGQMTTAIPVHMLLNNVLPQTTGQDNTNYCDVAPSVEHAAPINSNNADNVPYTNDDMEHFPRWGQFITEVDPGTQPEYTVTMPSSLQMPQTWDDNVYMNSTSAQGPTSATTSLSAATRTTTMSADTSLAFSNAAWDHPSDETQFGLESNRQASSFHSSQLLETYDPALDQSPGQAVQDALQAVVEGAITETDTSGHGLDIENQGQTSSSAMAVQETAGFSDGLSFLDDLNDHDDDVDWDLESLLGDDPTPDICTAQGVDDQTHSGHSN